MIAQDETGNDYIVARADESPRANVRQLRQDGLTKVVNFNQG